MYFGGDDSDDDDDEEESQWVKGVVTDWDEAEVTQPYSQLFLSRGSNSLNVQIFNLF